MSPYQIVHIKPGVIHYPGYFDVGEQVKLVTSLRSLVADAPMFTPTMPRTGKPFSVQMTNLGSLGWISDRQGYRYQRTHPVTQLPWPPIPQWLLDAWHEVGDYPLDPEACLVNLYATSAKMGLHQDRDEADLEAPVVSVSLGDTGVFRVGGTARGGPTRSFHLESGDVVVLTGESRLSFHGIDRVIGKTSTLLRDGGRLNLTMRRVSPRDLSRIGYSRERAAAHVAAQKKGPYLMAGRIVETKLRIPQARLNPAARTSLIERLTPCGSKP